MPSRDQLSLWLLLLTFLFFLLSSIVVIVRVDIVIIVSSDKGSVSKHGMKKITSEFSTAELALLTTKILLFETPVSGTVAATRFHAEGGLTYP